MRDALSLMTLLLILLPPIQCQLHMVNPTCPLASTSPSCLDTNISVKEMFCLSSLGFFFQYDFVLQVCYSVLLCSLCNCVCVLSCLVLSFLPLSCNLHILQIVFLSATSQLASTNSLKFPYCSITPTLYSCLH